MLLKALIRPGIRFSRAQASRPKSARKNAAIINA
jgi:hypothetical protein